MKWMFVAIGACGLAVGLASGDPVPPVPASASISIPVLIEQLGAETYADREGATINLEKIGTPAMEALQAATRHASPEVRERASVILARLRRVAETGTRVTAKQVKLEYRDVPLGTALNDLKARTGLNLVLDPARVANPLRRVSCETGELPVWEALEAFCIAAELREAFLANLDVPKPTGSRRGYVPPPAAPNADSIPVVLIDGKPDRLAGDRSTAVRIVALPPGFPGHKVTLGTGETTLCLDVTPAPGLHWQEVAGVKITRVIDSAGRPGGAGTEKNVVPNHDPTGAMVFVRPGVAMRFDTSGNPLPPETIPNPRVVAVPLRIGTSTAGSLKRLEGAVYAEVQVPNQHLIVVTDPQRNTNGAANGPGELRFTVLEVKEAPGPGGLGTIKVQLEYPSPWVANARRRGGFNPGWPEPPRHPGQGHRVEAFDSAGKPFPVTSTGFTDLSDDGIINIQTIQFTFRPGLGVPAKLVVVGPKTVLVEIPFALENVLLP